jgi:CRISPR-associated endonuclease Cas2
MNTFLIAYDICDAKRLNKVRKLAYSFSIGGQKSAIEAPLRKEEIGYLLTTINALIKQNEDKINVVLIEDKPILLGKGNFIKYEEGAIIL